jgi:hypothetical protein
VKRRIVVSKTILVPDWGANEELQSFREERKGLKEFAGQFRGFNIKFDMWFGCDVIVIDGRPRDILEGSLADVPMEYISILQNNAPYRGLLHDGWYSEDVEVPGTDGYRFTAQVETYCRDIVLQQSIRVTVSNSGIVGVNKWFDALLRGEKNEFCDKPAPLPDQPQGQVLKRLERAHELFVRTRRASSREQLIELLDEIFRTFPPIEGFDEPTDAEIKLDEARKLVVELLRENSLSDYTRRLAEGIAVNIGAELDEER